MTSLQSLKRFAPALLAFVLVAFGTLMVLPKDDDVANADQRQPTLVLTDDAEAGTPIADLVTEVRMLEVDARATGALTSIEGLPEGVLVTDHVAGQQLLATSFAANVVEGLGKGFVAVSVRLDAQRWVGPLVTTGDVVDVYDIGVDAATPIAREAVVLEAPAPTDLGPRDESVISLGVPESSLSEVLVAASANRIWLVGA
ncbi:MAG: hypothetical protein RL547_1376 [Actinomycetota bacterium]